MSLQGILLFVTPSVIFEIILYMGLYKSKEIMEGGNNFALLVAGRVAEWHSALIFMTCLSYRRTAGYHILQIGSFDIQIKMLFHVFSFFAPYQWRGTISVLYVPRQH